MWGFLTRRREDAKGEERREEIEKRRGPLGWAWGWWAMRDFSRKDAKTQRGR
jgi:hypothetical protein